MPGSLDYALLAQRSGFFAPTGCSCSYRQWWGGVIVFFESTPPTQLYFTTSLKEILNVMGIAPIKIFGIGFHKTGTTSLAAALDYLGFKVTGPNGVNNPRIEQEVEEMVFKLVETYDAFQDNPWPVLYRKLDVQYPGSKFILTLRPTNTWIKSIVEHFGSQTTPMREWIYGIGYPKGNEHIYITRYETHNREVLDYFRHRPQDLVVLNITEGEGWEKLCPFLGRVVPSIPFPHLNKAQDKKIIAGAT